MILNCLENRDNKRSEYMYFSKEPIPMKIELLDKAKNTELNNLLNKEEKKIVLFY